MAEYPYILKCWKCNVEFRSETPHRQRCPNCIGVSNGTIQYPKVYYKNKKIVFERDEFKCQCCGCVEDDKKLNKIIVHHIDVDKKNNSPSNLITLCVQCHLSLHRKHGEAILRRSNIYKLFAQEKKFGEFGKCLIYTPAKKLVKKQYGGKKKAFFKITTLSKK